MELKQIIEKTRGIVRERLNELIPDDDMALTKAMRYSLLGTGKRLRPLLIMETAKIFNPESSDDIITVAAAIEMIHVFSLIHDDLPAMDDDDYRRGEPTCHKKFTEHEAILAGDSLVPLASEVIITKTKNLTDKEKCDIILAISRAIGYKGMCLGQSLDVGFEKSGTPKKAEDAELINTYKTGYLFKSCIEIGCILGKASKEDTDKLIEYSLNFGKAFQLMDDLEDNEIQEKDIQKTKEKIVMLVNNSKNYLNALKNKNQESIRVLELIAEFCLKNQ